MHGISIEWREAQFLLETVMFSRRGEEGCSILTLARMDGPFRSIPQLYWVAAGGSVRLIKLGSFWGAGLSFLLDRWVKLGSSHCWGPVYVFSLCWDAGLDLPLHWEVRLNSVLPDIMLDLLPGRKSGLGSGLWVASLNLLLGWRSMLNSLLRWEAGVT